MWNMKDCYGSDMKWKMYELAMQYWLNHYAEFARKYEITSNLTISAFGWCKTFNIIGYDKMFKSNTNADYFKYQTKSNYQSRLKLEKLTNETIFSIRKEAGVRASVEFGLPRYMQCYFKAGCNRESVHTTIVIHSSDEIPDLRHRKFDMQIYDFLKITIEPQIKITDETLLGLDITE